MQKLIVSVALGLCLLSTSACSSLGLGSCSSCSSCSAKKSVEKKSCQCEACKAGKECPFMKAKDGAKEEPKACH